MHLYTRVRKTVRSVHVLYTVHMHPYIFIPACIVHPMQNVLMVSAEARVELKKYSKQILKLQQQVQRLTQTREDLQQDLGRSERKPVGASGVIATRAPPLPERGGIFSGGPDIGGSVSTPRSTHAQDTRGDGGSDSGREAGGRPSSHNVNNQNNLLSEQGKATDLPVTPTSSPPLSFLSRSSPLPLSLPPSSPLAPPLITHDEEKVAGEPCIQSPPKHRDRSATKPKPVSRPRPKSMHASRGSADTKHKPSPRTRHQYTRVQHTQRALHASSQTGRSLPSSSTGRKDARSHQHLPSTPRHVLTWGTLGNAHGNVDSKKGNHAFKNRRSHANIVNHGHHGRRAGVLKDAMRGSSVRNTPIVKFATLDDLLMAATPLNTSRALPSPATPSVQAQALVLAQAETQTQTQTTLPQSPSLSPSPSLPPTAAASPSTLVSTPHAVPVSLSLPPTSLKHKPLHAHHTHHHTHAHTHAFDSFLSLKHMFPKSNLHPRPPSDPSPASASASLPARLNARSPYKR